MSGSNNETPAALNEELSREELIDQALLNNIAGGRAKVCWSDTCGDPICYPGGNQCWHDTCHHYCGTVLQ